GAWATSRHRDVDTLARRSCRFDVSFQVLLGLVQRLHQSGFSGLDELTESSTSFRRDTADQLLGGCEGALFAEMARAQLRQRTLFGARCFQIECGERGWITSKVRKAFELLLER